MQHLLLLVQKTMISLTNHLFSINATKYKKHNPIKDMSFILLLIDEINSFAQTINFSNA